MVSNLYVRRALLRKRMAFLTTRFVEADDSEVAGQLAIEKLRGERKFSKLVAGNRTQKPYIHIDEVAEVREEDIPEVNIGYVYFDDPVN